jgi:hypothetical protein
VIASSPRALRREARAIGGLAALLALAAPASARAQGDELSVALDPPAALHAGDRAEIVARVSGAGPHPLLLTPRSEGTAVEVVRGRLMRADARDPDAEVLELRIPVVARSAGTAVIRVEAAGYACAERCRRVRAEAAAVLRVAPAVRDRREGAPAPRKGSASDTEGAGAEGGPRRSSLSWVRLPGAEGCVASAALARAVEAQLGRSVFVSAARAELAVEGRVARADGAYRAVLQVTNADGAILGERTLESRADGCGELGEMATVAVALMIDPLTAPAPPAGGEAQPEVVVRTERVEVPVPAPAEPSGWRVEVDAALVGSVGLSPLPNLGGASAVIVEPPGFVPFAVAGALFPFSRAAQGGAHADFLHVHAGVQLCPLGLREGGLALHGCLGADAGAVFVWGGELAVDERERVIGQGHAVLRGHWDVVGPLTVRLALHFLVPFRQGEPFTAGGEPFYTPEPVAGMLDLGAGLHFD